MSVQLPERPPPSCPCWSQLVSSGLRRCSLTPALNLGHSSTMLVTLVQTDDPGLPKACCHLHLPVGFYQASGCNPDLERSQPIRGEAETPPTAKTTQPRCQHSAETKTKLRERWLYTCLQTNANMNTSKHTSLLQWWLYCLSPAHPL